MIHHKSSQFKSLTFTNDWDWQSTEIDNWLRLTIVWDQHGYFLNFSSLAQLIATFKTFCLVCNWQTDGKIADRLTLILYYICILHLSVCGCVFYNLPFYDFPSFCLSVCQSVTKTCVNVPVVRGEGRHEDEGQWEDTRSGQLGRCFGGYGGSWHQTSSWQRLSQESNLWRLSLNSLLFSDFSIKMSSRSTSTSVRSAPPQCLPSTSPNSPLQGQDLPAPGQGRPLHLSQVPLCGHGPEQPYPPRPAGPPRPPWSGAWCARSSRSARRRWSSISPDHKHFQEKVFLKADHSNVQTVITSMNSR